MKLIVCIDTKKGMMFSGRRQSQDSALRKWIIEHTKGKRLWMSSYSSKQFGDIPDYIVDDDYVSKADEDDYCFVEDKDYSVEKAKEIILCHWNRQYQSDRKFDVDLKANGFKKVKSADIAGSSHKKITIETYQRG